MAFTANPLSLSVPEPAFETWLRDHNYLDILDQRTSDLHRLSTTTSTTATTTTTLTTGFLIPIFSRAVTLLSLFTFNPFSKLASDDFSGDTPSWAYQFVGGCESYSCPSSVDQARFRVHENVKRFARNYATLFILFFACSLYQMPVALVGLISSLALWEVFRFCGDRWGLGQYPVFQQSLVRVVQCATAVILFFSNVQMALFFALGVSYTAVLLHASFRKLTPTKQATRGRSK